MNLEQCESLVEYLSGFVLGSRLDVLHRVLAQRTDYMAVAVADLYHGHNASAVVRTCDCFGVQTLFAHQGRNAFLPEKEITMGADKWVTVKLMDGELLDTVSHLRSQGYRIVATTPHGEGCVSLSDFDVAAGPFALLFGSERQGLERVVVEACDQCLTIPMFGFTESLNISVSAAIALQHLAGELRRHDVDWQLSRSRRADVMLEWLMGSVKDAHRIAQKWLDMNYPGIVL